MKKGVFICAGVSVLLFASCVPEQEPEVLSGLSATVTLSDPLNITYNSVRFVVNVESNQYRDLERGICWSKTPAPVMNATTTYCESLTNRPFEYTISPLEHGNSYYVRAFVTNYADTVYSNEVHFTLPTLKVPEISTMEAYSITATSAVSGGVISFDGGSPLLMKGLMWSTNRYLSTYATAGYVSEYMSFIHTMRNLSPSTTYYVRAYAENALGKGYGQIVQFTTSAN